jgi:uncharacterized damage-inducible protein DinB
MDQDLAATALQSWDRHATALHDLIAALSPEQLQARAHPTSPSVAEQVDHLHATRLFWMAYASEKSPDWSEAGPPPSRDVLLGQLAESAGRLRALVASRLVSGQPLAIYGHPLFLQQHLLWHEAYHVGQIALALKTLGLPLTEPQTDRIWDTLRPPCP